MKTKIFAFVCVLLLLLSFCSCSLNSAKGIIDAYLTEQGELVLVYDNGEVQTLGDVVGKDGKDGKDGKNGKDGDGSSNGTDGTETAFAVATGLRSAVSIVSKFQATIQSSGFFPNWGGTRTEQYSSGGSGVIYKLDTTNGDAFVITNYHVVYDSSSDTANGISDDISVYLYGSAIEEKAIKATYVGGSLYYDIAVLRIENNELLKDESISEVEIANSDFVSVGETAIAIGNAEGLGISACAGVVSVDSEYITMLASDGRTEVAFRVMRVDAAVNSGNSGGGLYNKNGELIGIVNAKIVDDGVENIGYAIPSNVAVAIAENIIDYCYNSENERVQRALIGITVDVTDSKAVYNSESGLVSIKETVAVDEIIGSSPAESVLKTGDILVSVTIGEKTLEITRRYHIIDMMLELRVGDTVVLNILRDGESTVVEIEITEDCLVAY